MIHYTAEGAYLKLGLNFRFTGGGILLLWAWYDIARQEMTTHRVRLRFRRSWFMYARNRWNVIDAHLQRHDLELVSREVLKDLKAAEESDKKWTDRYSYINRA